MRDYYVFEHGKFKQFDDKDLSSRKVKATSNEKIAGFSLSVHTIDNDGSELTVVDVDHEAHGDLGSVVFFRPIYALELFAFLKTVGMDDHDNIQRQERALLTLKSIDETLEGIWRTL
jgi:hypothetical protein